MSWSTLTVLSALAVDEDVSRRCARVGRWPVTAPRSASSTRTLFAKRHERWTRGPPSWSTVPAGHWDAPLASWAAMTFPDLVVVTGGLSLAGELLLTTARSEMRRVGPPGIVAGLDVQVGRCGADAALLGAAIEAQRVQETNSAAGQEAVA